MFSERTEVKHWLKMGSVFAKSRETFEQSRIIYNSFLTQIQRTSAEYLFMCPKKHFFRGSNVV